MAFTRVLLVQLGLQREAIRPRHIGGSPLPLLRHPGDGLATPSVLRHTLQETAEMVAG